jgi:hypothetical protein
MLLLTCCENDERLKNQNHATQVLSESADTAVMTVTVRPSLLRAPHVDERRATHASSEAVPTIGSCVGGSGMRAPCLSWRTLAAYANRVAPSVALLAPLGALAQRVPGWSAALWMLPAELAISTTTSDVVTDAPTSEQVAGGEAGGSTETGGAGVGGDNSFW